MRDTEASIDVCGIICKEDGDRFLPRDSANVLSLKIATSDVGFPISVYGTLIARDSLDLKCIYLFRCDTDHCQLLKSKDQSLIVSGPKRGLALIGAIYFEIDLKIKGDGRQKDKQLSKGFITLDGIPHRLQDKMMVEREYLDSKLSKVVVTFAVVKFAVEATIAIEVVKGKFYGEITAHTTSIQDRIVLHESKVGNVKGAIQLLRSVV